VFVNRRRARLAVGALAAVLVASCGGASGEEVPAGPAGTQAFADLARDHVQRDVEYPQSPPVGGPHHPVWQNCGVYRDPIADENAVHSMEHGAVWIAYGDELDDEAVAALETLARERTHVLVAPYPALGAEIVATGWGRQLRVDDATDARLAEFVATFEQGPQTPESGAPCSGGLGTPVRA